MRQLRWLLLLLVPGLCFAAVPLGPSTPPLVVAERADVPEDAPLTAERFLALAKTDVLAMLRASMSHYRATVRGYHCKLLKQECVRGVLGKKEVVQVAFRDDPFAVQMKWREGAGLASATLYAEGENGGKLKAKTFIGVQDSDPTSGVAELSSRYTIQDFGIYRGMARTLQVWKAAHDRGRLKVEFLETKPIPECGGRVCHVIRRICDPAEVDNFSMADTRVKSPEKFPKEAIREVILMFDAETFLQVGTELRHPDGSLIGTYYFRDIELNPIFRRDQFLPSILK